MAYVRKTYDEYQIQGNYGCGWEEVTAEDSYKAAREQLKCYRENEPQYPHRLKIVRIRKPEVTCPNCKQPIWDVAKGSKLNKCWGCGLAFDSME